MQIKKKSFRKLSIPGKNETIIREIKCIKNTQNNFTEGCREKSVT